MIAYYINSAGERINLLKKPFRMVEADLFDSEWEENVDGFEKTVSIDIFDDKSKLKENMETLYKVFAYDSENNAYGRLYINDTYLFCRVKSSKKSDWKGFIYAVADLTFYAPVLEWISESKKSFFAGNIEDLEDTRMDFPFDFAFDFKKPENGIGFWNIDHIIPSDFSMIIYGPCVEPEITINNHIYQVYTSLLEGEYLLVNSQDCSVVKYLSDGQTEDLFDDRGDGLFEKIPSGYLTVLWSGDFGFDIVLYKVRREPEW
ncbi:MAG: hypothetical protein U0L05_01440 [Schaedlerella sp.]|nr:hypothetical protein [Schaedlerella sp.]